MDLRANELAGAWCDATSKHLARALSLLRTFDERWAEAHAEIRAFVASIKDGGESPDDTVLKLGPAAVTREFESLILTRLSSKNFEQQAALTEIRSGFGPRIAKAPEVSFESGLLSLEAQAKRALALSPSAFTDESTPHQLTSNKGYELLAQLKAASLPLPAPRQEGDMLYVPKAKRGQRTKTALWTLGILFVLASVSGWWVLWAAFLGAGGFFVASAVVTSQEDSNQSAERDGIIENLNDLKNAISALALEIQEALSSIEQHIDARLDALAKEASSQAKELVSFLKAASYPEPSSDELVFGTACASPIVTTLANQGHLSSFDEISKFDPKLVKASLPFEGSSCRLVVPECDRLTVYLAADADPGQIARSVVASVLGTFDPGRARFMFVEPGRLAEAYRVFGALNESDTTRLADRLFVTHVNELATAVDALRTFVGRAKEAMTRFAEDERRITSGQDARKGFALQRAFVVLDETSQEHWPERDRRRLREYLDEVAALAEVGAAEGSVMLLRLLRGDDAALDSALQSARSRAARATPQYYTFACMERAVITDFRTGSEYAAACDDWVKRAKKVDSSLRQEGRLVDWSDAEASDSRYGLEIEIGRHGVDRPAKLILGREGGHHAISIGRTGSGKTNLFHVIISNLVRRYSPEELELYLLDFKEGVEFAAYADVALPHCRAVAIDADRAFGLSVLMHLRRELNRRANVFKAAGVGIANLERYEEVTGQNMPRIVLLIDEFQVLLQSGERTPGVATGAAASALEDLVRRGRSFGLHVILGSQTLAGRELTAATLGQLAVRIVLPCSAPDAAMLLGEQPVASQLRSPGDAIVWRAGQGEVSDAHLAKIYAANLNDLPHLAEASRAHSLAQGTSRPPPFVFRGSGPTGLPDFFPHLQSAKAEAAAGSLLIAVGAPTAFGDRPIGALRKSRSRNLLMVHRAEETRNDFLYAALESFLRLQPEQKVALCDLEGGCDFNDVPFADRLHELFPNRVELIVAADLEVKLASIAAAFGNGSTADVALLAIAGAGRANLSRSSFFSRILKEGPETGLHVIATCDSVRNLERVIDRPMLAEFGMRVLGPATSGDSQRLLESNEAEGLTSEHQYLLVDDFHPGKTTRLQVLTPTFEESSDTPESSLEVAHG